MDNNFITIDPEDFRDIQEYYQNITSDELIDILNKQGMNLTKEIIFNKFIETYSLFETAAYLNQNNRLTPKQLNNPNTILQSLFNNPFIYLIPKIVDEYKYH